MLLIFLFAVLSFTGCELSKCVDNSEMESMFYTFMKTHEKQYPNDVEQNKRYYIFCENVQYVMEMKKKASNEDDWSADWMGVSMFMDLTPTEFRSKYLSVSVPPAKCFNRSMVTNYKFGTVKDIPTDFNWNDHGAVGRVRQQGECGSCWAFAACGNMEGQWYLKKGELLEFSEQQIINCDKKSAFCLGGLIDYAFAYVIRTGGIETEKEYPYHGWLEERCKFDKSKIVANITSFENLPKDEEKIKEYCYSNGPIAIALDAILLQFYIGGVFDPPGFLCPGSELDHGLLIVGWGQKGKKDYWIIKNSWGAHWGEKGFFKLKRGDSKCGVDECASSSIV